MLASKIAHELRFHFSTHTNFELERKLKKTASAFQSLPVSNMFEVVITRYKRRTLWSLFSNDGKNISSSVKCSVVTCVLLRYLCVRQFVFAQRWIVSLVTNLFVYSLAYSHTKNTFAVVSLDQRRLVVVQQQLTRTKNVVATMLSAFRNANQTHKPFD